MVCSGWIIVPYERGIFWKMDSIARFSLIVEELKCSIKDIEDGPYLTNFRKILLFSLLELLAKAAYPNENTNRKKFVRFISQFCGWEDANRISIPKLLVHLERHNSLEIPDLKEFAKNKINTWPAARPIKFFVEPTIEDINNVVPLEALDEFELEKLTHARLFWDLRNMLVHELRSFESKMDLFELEVPHYVPMKEVHRDNDTVNLYLGAVKWKLHYPEAFYYCLIDKGIKNLNSYFFNEIQGDPFEGFAFDFD